MRRTRHDAPWLYPNLRNEIDAAGLTLREMGEKLYSSGMKLGNVGRGATQCQLEFAYQIRDTFFPHLSIEYLFAPYGQEWKAPNEAD